MNAMARINRGLREMIARAVTRTITPAMNAGAYGASIPYEPRRGEVGKLLIEMKPGTRTVARGIVAGARSVARCRSGIGRPAFRSTISAVGVAAIGVRGGFRDRLRAA